MVYAAMLAKLRSMVTGKNNQAVIINPHIFKPVKETALMIIRVANLTVVQHTLVAKPLIDILKWCFFNCGFQAHEPIQISSEKLKKIILFIGFFYLGQNFKRITQECMRLIGKHEKKKILSVIFFNPAQGRVNNFFNIFIGELFLPFF